MRCLQYLNSMKISRITLIGIVFITASIPLSGQSTDATMTLYKDGTALIKQPVEWSIQTGITRVKHDIFPSGLLEDSPFLTIEGARVGYQRLHRDVFSWETYFAEQVGKEVELRTVSGDETEGLLQQFNSNRVVLQQKNNLKLFARKQIEWLTVEGSVEDPQYKPYLSWDLYSRTNQTVHGSLIYLSNGFAWNAIYRLVLDADTTQAELVTEAVISNRSNLDFSDLELQLVEGNLHRVGPGSGLSKRGGLTTQFETARAFDSAPAQPLRESLGDYHIYSLPERIGLNGQESVIVRLYNPSRINYVKTYLFKNSEQSKREEPLSVEYKFANSEENELNKPLPQGKVEIYQVTRRGGIEFVGEDHIRQVPKGEEVVLIAGRSFDVIGKRKVLNYDRQRKSEQATIELTVTNTRTEDISVRLIETIRGEWVIRDESSMYIKVDANTIYFPLTVPAGETTRVTYTYRKAWN